MEIEIVEFYEYKRDDKKQFLAGTLHVYIVDLEIDLRGVSVFKKKNFWFFKAAHLCGIDPETKAKVKYPAFIFANQKKNEELSNLIREKGKEYIIKNVLKQNPRKNNESGNFKLYNGNKGQENRGRRF